MKKWFVLTYNSIDFDKVNRRINELGVVIYSPEVVEIKKRSDCNSCRIVSKRLFPGYLFVHLDPEITHTTTISTVPGAKGFVRFGGEPAVVDESIIEALKEAIFLISNDRLDTLECRNVPVEIIETLKYITELRSIVERQAAFLSLLQKSNKLVPELPPSARIFSTLITHC
jgi:transcriptional antiterminator RfaH